MEGILAFHQAVSALPGELAGPLLAFPEELLAAAEEVRMRTGSRPTLRLADREIEVTAAPAVTRPLLQQVVERCSRWSLHTVLDQTRRGYVTLEGGHRLGLCGTAVMEGERVLALRELTSVNLRIARAIPGLARPLAEQICRGGRPENTLILAPPGAGKTTLLRDLIRLLSDGGEGRGGLRVSVADERGELAAGGPCLLGRRTDVLSGCPKATAIGMLLRAMAPQVIAVDEITEPEDVAAMELAAGCGAALLATAHADGVRDLRSRALYRHLMSRGIFERIVVIRVEDSRRVLDVLSAEDAAC